MKNKKAVTGTICGRLFLHEVFRFKIGVKLNQIIDKNYYRQRDYRKQCREDDSV